MNAIVYCSRSLVDFSDDDLFGLSSRAAEVNALNGVTGHLYYAANRFVQYIEGRREELQLVMDRIVQDERHEILHQFSQESLEARRFPDWSMYWLRRSDFVQLRMETLLTDYVAAAARSPDLTGFYEPRVWNSVERIADFARCSSRRK